MRMAEVKVGEEYLVSLGGIGFYELRRDRPRAKVLEKGVEMDPPPQRRWGARPVRRKGVRVKFINGNANGYPAWRRGEERVVPTRLIINRWAEYVEGQRQAAEAKVRHEEEKEIERQRIEAIVKRLRALDFTNERSYDEEAESREFEISRRYSWGVHIAFNPSSMERLLDCAERAEP